jgi:hypothetical protein
MSPDATTTLVLAATTIPPPPKAESGNPVLAAVGTLYRHVLSREAGAKPTDSQLDVVVAIPDASADEVMDIDWIGIDHGNTYPSLSHYNLIRTLVD